MPFILLNLLDAFSLCEDFLGLSQYCLGELTYINSFKNNNTNNNLFNALYLHFSNHFHMWDFIFIISNFRSNCCYLISEKITLSKEFLYTTQTLFFWSIWTTSEKKKKSVGYIELSILSVSHNCHLVRFILHIFRLHFLPFTFPFPFLSWQYTCFSLYKAGSHT